MRELNKQAVLEAIRSGRVKPEWTNRQIGEALGYSPRSIVSYLRELREAGHITISYVTPHPTEDRSGRRVTATATA